MATISLSMHISDDDREYLTKFAPHVNIETCTKDDRPHSRAAAIRKIQNTLVYLSAAALGKALLDIGGNFLETFNLGLLIYTISPIIDSKDYSRYTVRMLSILKMITDFNDGKVEFTPEQYRHLVNIYTENADTITRLSCGYLTRPFEVAVMNHAGYDISLDMIAEQFHRSGIKILYGVQHYDPIMEILDHAPLPELKARYKIVNGKIYFSFDDDASTTYIHNFETFRAIANHNLIITNYDFDIFIEITNFKAHSIYYTMTRVPKGYSSVIHRSLPLSSFADYYILNSYTADFKISSTRDIREKYLLDPNVFLINKAFIDKVYKFGREMIELDLKDLIKYMRGTDSRVIINGTEITSTDNLPPSLFNQIVLAVFFQLMVDRDEIEDLRGLFDKIHHVNRSSSSFLAEFFSASWHYAISWLPFTKGSRTAALKTRLTDHFKRYNRQFTNYAITELPGFVPIPSYIDVQDTITSISKEKGVFKAYFDEFKPHPTYFGRTFITGTGRDYYSTILNLEYKESNFPLVKYEPISYSTGNRVVRHSFIGTGHYANSIKRNKVSKPKELSSLTFIRTLQQGETKIRESNIKYAMETPMSIVRLPEHQYRGADYQFMLNDINSALNGKINEQYTPISPQYTYHYYPYSHYNLSHLYEVFYILLLYLSIYLSPFFLNGYKYFFGSDTGLGLATSQRLTTLLEGVFVPETTLVEYIEEDFFLSLYSRLFSYHTRLLINIIFSSVTKIFFFLIKLAYHFPAFILLYIILFFLIHRSLTAMIRNMVPKQDNNKPDKPKNRRDKRENYRALKKIFFEGDFAECLQIFPYLTRVEHEAMLSAMKTQNFTLMSNITNDDSETEEKFFDAESHVNLPQLTTAESSHIANDDKNEFKGDSILLPQGKLTYGSHFDISEFKKTIGEALEYYTYAKAVEQKLMEDFEGENEKKFEAAKLSRHILTLKIQSMNQMLNLKTIYRPLVMKFIEAPPGCGKSTEIISKAQAGDVIAAANRNTKEELFEKISKKSKLIPTHTIDSLVMTQKTYYLCKKLYIDEVSLNHFADILTIIQKLRPQEVYLYGDNQQISFINRFSKAIALFLQKIPTSVEREYRKVTYRCPQDISQWLKGIYGNDFTTTSKRKSSVKKHYILGPQGINYSKYDIILTFTQNEKDLIKVHSKTTKVLTIHEDQGDTKPKVCLVRLIKDPIDIYDSRSHVNVGLTRHTVSLDYYSVVHTDNTFIESSIDMCVQIGKNMGFLLGSKEN